MAGRRQKTTKKTKNKASSAKRQKKVQGEQTPKTVRDEIWILGSLALSAFLLLSSFGVCGALGNLISSVFFGLFGMMAYLFPVILFFGVSFHIANREGRIAHIKLAASCVAFVFADVLIHMITVPSYGTEGLLDIYRMGSEKHLGGGIFGGGLARLFYPILGTVGSYVLVIALLMICVVLISQRSIFIPLGKKGKEAYRRASEQRKEQKKDPEPKKPQKVNFDLKKQMEPVMPISINHMDDEVIMPSEPIKEEIIFEEPEHIPVQISESAVERAEEKAAITKVEETTAEEKQQTASEIETALEQKPEYVFPPMNMLEKGVAGLRGDSDAHLRETALKLKQALDSFGVKVQVTNVTCGPTVTQYELLPDQGVKVSRILSLANDIKLNLAVSDIRIEAPIPGKSAIGIEVPNKKNTPVKLRDLLESAEFKNNDVQIPFAVGRDISGKVIVGDITTMPHLLIAGATGSGKSVCINTLIMSIIYSSKPEDVRLIMVDPKVVELSVYNGIPHLLIPVVTDPKKAAGALNWAVMEMTDRYNKFAELNVRDLKGYNAKVTQSGLESENYPKLPKIVIIVDELADLMMVASNEVEDAIARLAQLARACGIHLVIATQRPSVNVITGTIKANILSRIAFTVASQVDSRTIIDMAGAEKLLGKGDMLYAPGGTSKPVRVQGAFVSDEEVMNVVSFLKESQNGVDNYNTEMTTKITSASSVDATSVDEKDIYFVDAGKFIIEKDKASIGMLQRVFRIGFNRAARIMDQLYEAGVVGPEEGTKPRKVLMSPEEFEAYIEEYL